MSRGIVKFLIILLLVYLVTGVAINLTIENKTIDNLKENPILILGAPFQYVLELINKKG